MKKYGISLLIGLVLGLATMAEAAHWGCTLSVRNYYDPTQAALNIIGDATSLETIPTKCRLESRIRTCGTSSLCLRTANTFNILPSDICKVSLWACPSIVRTKKWYCRRTLTLVKQKNSVLGQKKTLFASTVPPVALDRRKRQTQVSFQAVTECPYGGSTVTIKSNVTAMNVTCKNGTTMNRFMRKLQLKTD